MSTKAKIIILGSGILIAVVLVAVLLMVFRANNGVSSPGGGLADFLPFGSGSGDRPFPAGGAGDPGGALNEQGVDDPAQLRPAPAIQQITATPVAAAVPFRQFSEAGTTTMVRYTDRGSGHILEANLEVLSPEPVKVANTTIPRVQRGHWSSNASTTIYQYLDDSRENVLNFAGTLISTVQESASSTPQEEGGGVQFTLSGRFLPMNAYGIAFSPGGNNLFYLVSTTVGSVGYLAGPNGTAPEAVFTSPLVELAASWSDPSTILITTRAAATAPGFAFTLNPQTETEEMVLGGLNALSTLASPDGKWILYFALRNGTPSLSLLDRETRVSTRLSVVTLPEKCVWGGEEVSELWCAVPATVPPTDYPDVWYQGAFTHSDTFWHIIPATGTANQLAIEGGEGVDVDAINLTLSPDRSFITFIDKADGSLWSLRTGLQPLAPAPDLGGSEPAF